MDPTPDPNALGFLITDSARLIRTQFEKRITEAGLNLTPGEARTLLHVAAADGCRQLELAARMNIEPMTVCAFLDKLQAAGLIERQQDPTDKRAKKVVLTEGSATMVDAIRAELVTVTSKATEGLSPKVQAMLLDALTLFRNNLQRADPAAPDA